MTDTTSVNDILSWVRHLHDCDDTERACRIRAAIDAHYAHPTPDPVVTALRRACDERGALIRELAEALEFLCGGDATPLESYAELRERVSLWLAAYPTSPHAPAGGEAGGEYVRVACVTSDTPMVAGAFYTWNIKGAGK